MKFLSLGDSFHLFYLKNFKSRHKNINQLPHKDQLKIRLDDGQKPFNFIARKLRPFGFETKDVMQNTDFLMASRQKELGIKFRFNLDYIDYEINEFKPNILFIQNPFVVNRTWLNNIRTKCSSIKKIFGWVGFPYNKTHLEHFKNFDFMLSCNPGIVKGLNQEGLKTYLMDLFFDKSFYKEKLGTETKKDIIFIGSLKNSDRELYQNRIQILEGLSRSKVIKKQLKIHPNANFSHIITSSKILAYYLVNFMKNTPLKALIHRIQLLKRVSRWNSRPSFTHLSPTLKSLIHPNLYGAEMYNALQSALVGLNTHIDENRGFAGNWRLFETAGVGTCLLTDWTPNISDFFKEDTEVVTYKNTEECVEKAKWLLENREKAIEIGQAGQARVYAEHLTEHRAEFLAKVIKKELDISI